MQYTENYQLPQWAEDDRIMMGDFNKAMADIDRGLAGVARDGAAALAQAVGSGGQNCRVAFGSYVGNGKSGYADRRTLTLGFRPLVLFITTAAGSQYGPTVMVRPAQQASVGYTNGTAWGAWGSREVTWGGGDENCALNSKDTTYYYVAIGDSET